MRKYDLSVWGHYGLGHNLGILFAEIMPKTTGLKAAEIRVTRAARDVLFAAYKSISENPELMSTVPAKNRPEVNLLPSPNASIPPGNPHSSSEVGAAHAQTNPERTYGQAHSRGGEANTTTHIDTGLALVGLYGPYRLWLPNGWFDCSVFRLGDTNGEEET